MNRLRRGRTARLLGRKWSIKHTRKSSLVRAGRATYIGSAHGGLQGCPALVMMDQEAPWLILAQFDDLAKVGWAHGWHPLPASSFGPIDYDHDWAEPVWDGTDLVKEECDCMSLETHNDNVTTETCKGDWDEPHPAATCIHCGVKDSTFEEHGTPCIGEQAPIAWSTNQRFIDANLTNPYAAAAKLMFKGVELVWSTPA